MTAPAAPVDPAVPELFAALGALGLPCLADAGVREAVAKFAVQTVRRFDAAPDLGAVRAGLARFDAEWGAACAELGVPGLRLDAR